MKRLAILLALVVVSQAEAGVVVLKNGTVFLGRIDPDDAREGAIVLRSPRLAPGATPARGEQVIPSRDVRWSSADADTLTDDYCEKFEKEPIDPRWAHVIEEWRTRRSLPPPEIPSVPSVPKLSAITISKDEVSLRKPVDWDAREAGDFLVVRKDDVRIQVFSVAAPAASVREQLRWIEEELAKLGPVTGTPEIRVVTGGHDVEWLTTTTHRGKTMRALRKIYFRERRVHFVTAYAPEAEWPGVERLLRTSLATVTVRD